MITLDRLVNVLGGYGVRLCNRPEARAAWLHGVAVPDAADPHVTGDLLLAIGTGSIEEAVRCAVAAKATAVLVRPAPSGGPGESGGGLDRQAAVLGDRYQVAVLLADPAMPWSQLAGVVYGLVLESRETASGRGPTDLFALADSLADTLGGAVTIEDRHSRVLAYSRSQQAGDPARLETILARRVPDRLRGLFQRRGVFDRLAAADEPVFVPADPEHGLTARTVVPVRAGRELLGSVWVTCERPPAGAHRRALADGAHTVALHLLRSRASADLERQVESDLIIRLLEGGADAPTVISRLGLAPQPLRVVAVRAHTDGDRHLGGERQGGVDRQGGVGRQGGGGRQGGRERQVDGDRHAALLLAFEQATTGFGWSRPGRSALLGDTLYTVLPAEQAGAARRWISALCAELPAHVRVAAGIGAPAEAAELPAGRQEADECLALHESRPGDVPPAYDESWDDILLRRLRAAVRTGRTPARGPVSTLLRHDARHGTRFVATLRAWLECQGDPVPAAERLGVHPNTVRNRLRKIGELTPLDLGDARQRLAMTIMLAAVEDEPRT
ncbi:PucR family transcriptional regulator [[Actinomadura] parvosata]|uniref:PucR family transcriptional regulator n=1 Tax=[Actinomadura] parvosata TaxID=1955412 RepID=UPI00406D4467